MKISKLFHWLYGILMLAPVFAVGITCLTHVFNETVEAETQTVDIEYEFELGTTPSYFNELEINKLYKLNPSSNEAYSDLQIKYITDNNNTYYSNAQNWLFLEIGEDYIYLYISGEDPLSFDINNTYIVQWGKDIQTYDFWQYYTDGDNTYNRIDDINITTVAQDDSTNIFYTSCEQVKDSFVLSWCGVDNPVRGAYDLGSSLFNIDSDNLVNYCLTYWTCISIVWLIFDVIMYVPLLVHRWIDKAKLE